MNLFRSIVIVAAVILASVSSLPAETGANGWLRYAPLSRGIAARYDDLPEVVISVGNSEVLNSAKRELVRGIGSMVGKRLRTEQNVPAENAFVMGTLKDVREHFREVDASRPLVDDSFWLETLQHGGKKYWLIIGGGGAGGVDWEVLVFFRGCQT